MNYNYLLFMPSRMRNNPPQIAYTAEDTSTPFYGYQTNIPATKYVLEKLSLRGEKLNGIFMICSKEVLEEQYMVPDQADPLTTYNYYIDTISADMHEYGYTDEEISAVFFKYPLEDINPGSWSSMNAVQNRILDDLSKNHSNKDDSYSLFVDYTGGLRSASMLLVFFAKLLESQGMTVEDVYYSNISKVDNKTGVGNGQIESCMDTYHVFDYLEAFASKDLGKLEDVFEADDIAYEINRTNEAQKKNKRGKYKEITDADREEVAITSEMNILLKMVAQELNRIRPSLTLEGAIRESISSGDAERASQRIKEHGLGMLLDKGIISWKSEFYREHKDDAFYAYAFYYRSYINFIWDMLSELKFDGSADDLRDSYKAYVCEHYELKPLLWPKGNINQFIENEFDYCYYDVAEQLQDTLVDDIRKCLDNPHGIIRAVDKYTKDRKRYIGAYAGVEIQDKKTNNSSGGFPFANIYKSRTYSEIDKDSDVWYDQEYKRALDAAMCQFWNMNDTDRIRIPNILNDNVLILAHVFPPIDSDLLFTVEERSRSEFGKYVLLMDSIRRNRNLFTHKGNTTTEEDVQRMNQMALEFLRLVEGSENER